MAKATIVEASSAEDALRRIDTEKKRAEAASDYEDAVKRFRRFLGLHATQIAAPQRWVIALAVKALGVIASARLDELLQHVGVAVQQSRATVKATLEIGSESLRLIRVLDERLRRVEATVAGLPEAAPVASVPMEACLRWASAEPKPADLPEGSTRTDAFTPRPTAVPPLATDSAAH